MPTTALGVWTPDGNDGVDFTIDLAAMAISIDSAILLSATRIIGTNEQRLALTAPALRDGLQFFATDTGLEWIYTSGSWRRAGVRVARYTWISNGIPDASLIANAAMTLDTTRTTDASIAPVTTGSAVRLQAGVYSFSYGLGSTRAMTGRAFLEIASSVPGPYRSNIMVGEDSGVLSGTFSLAAQTDVTFRFLLVTGGSANTTGSLLIAKLS